MANDIWKKMRLATQARIGLTRSGHAISTENLLEFQLAHAAARDAVLNIWDERKTAADLQAEGFRTFAVTSSISNRVDHLRRPDYGRKLSALSATELSRVATSENFEIVVAVTDGLSAKAIETHFAAFWKTFAPMLKDAGYIVSPIVLVPFGRVALSDEIGAALNAKLVLMFVGERPGLSSNDSMGIYLTYDPKLGRNDAHRNCISNIRPPQGLDYETASRKLMFLISESIRRKLSGVDLKEDAPRAIASSEKIKRL